MSLALTPRINSSLERFLQTRDQLFMLVNAFASPLNILFPEHLQHNIEGFNKVFKKHRVQGSIYYAHKPNKSNALVKQAAFSGIKIDVASLGELKSALSNGFTSSEIEATGPKNFHFMFLGLQHNITFNVDSFAELQALTKISRQLGKKTKTPVIVRLNSFLGESIKIISKDTRFGIKSTQILELIDFFKQNSELELEGFSFHLNSPTESEKALSLEGLIQITLSTLTAGLNPHIINIGGGFKINFLAHEWEWSEYVSQLKQSVLGNHEPLSWNQTGLGFWAEDGKIRGSATFFDYYQKKDQFQQLDDLLSFESKKLGNSLGESISENMIELQIEPGRSLLDQVGLTVARVNFSKTSAQGEIIIGLDMNRSNLDASDQEMMLDPVIIPLNPKTAVDQKKQVGVFFSGNLCLESDLIYKHKTYLDSVPKPGDLVVFINTAGYFMDFIESETLQQLVAEKIAIKEKNGEFIWERDKNYHPIEF